MHAVVDAKNRDIVFSHEVDFCFVQRVGADNRGVIPIVPVRVFMRNDHVVSGFGRALHDIKITEHRCGDPVDFSVRAAELERVSVGVVAPRSAEFGFDSGDNFGGSQGGRPS